jgi:hypothetical protein
MQRSYRYAFIVVVVLALASHAQTVLGRFEIQTTVS